MSLDKKLEKYLQIIEAAIHSLEDACIERYEEEILTPDRLNLRIRVRFNSKELLEINESVIRADSQLSHLAYRYHFQDKDNNLIFRYDNAPHFPSLETFPDHKHLSDNAIGNKRPLLIDVLGETADWLK